MKTASGAIYGPKREIGAQLKSIHAVFVLLSAVIISGCPSSAPPPPAFVGCGALTATVTGQYGIGSILPATINTTANVNDGGTSVTWQVPAQATGRTIDGAQAAGTIPTVAPRSFTATATSGDSLLTVTGTVTGPPPPCRATGTWTVTLIEDGRLVGRGRWTIP